MSCIALGQAAKVDKLFCTNMDLTGTLSIAPSTSVSGTELHTNIVKIRNSLILSVPVGLGSVAVPYNFSVIPTLTVNTATTNCPRVVLYGYNPGAPVLSICLDMYYANAISKYSFFISTQQINAYGPPGVLIANEMYNYMISPLIIDNSNVVLVAISFNGPLTPALSGYQRINILIMEDS